MTNSRRALRWQERVIPALGATLIRLLGLTWRVSYSGREQIEGLRARRQNFLFALWHGELLPLLWEHRSEGVTLLVSEHRDGELVARAAEHLGHRLVRGSTSRGGARALLELAAVLKRGAEAAVTPDGPRGPAHVFAPGALVAAQRAKVPILPIRASASSAWRLGSWDHFLIPKPFARVRVAYGEPTLVDGTSVAAAEADVPRFTELMSQTGRMIDA